MFTKAEFEALAAAIKRPTEWYKYTGYPGLHYTSYPQFAFQHPDSEEFICVTRSRKKPGDNGLLFWLAANLLPTRFSGVGANTFDKACGYLMGSAFSPIDELEANRLIEESCSALTVDLPLPLGGASPFLGALIMSSMATEFEVSVFVEYADAYLDFYWQSTA